MTGLVPPPFERLSLLGLPWPTDWTAVFGQPARPLVLEIGFGRGDFLVHLAARHPEAFVVGIEVSNRSLAAAERKLLRGEAPNARVVHASAEAALARLFAPSSLVAIHANFPDPWFKARHQGRRLFRPAVLDAMVSRLAPGGALCLATDILAYAEMAADLFARTPGLDNALPAPWADALPDRVVTKYEARARAEGRPCHYFVLRRNARPAPAVPVEEDRPMPHIVFEGAADLAALQAAFRRGELGSGATHVGLIAAYRADDALLIEAFVEEPSIGQRVALIMRRQGADRYVLGLGALGRPRATPGVHEAVALVARWLLERAGGLRVAEGGLVIDQPARRTFDGAEAPV